MWSTGLGHGDRFYVTDIDPERPSLEVWYSYEDPHPQNGVSLWDARTGNLIFGTDSETIDNEIDRASSATLTPPIQVWKSGRTVSFIRPRAKPSEETSPAGWSSLVGCRPIE